MKNFILGILCGVTILTACAKGAKMYRKPERNLQDKIYEPCLDSWVDGNPVGKFCNRTCVKRTKSGKCKDNKFKTIQRNFCDPEVFKWYRSGSWLLIQEDQFF